MMVVMRGECQHYKAIILAAWSDGYLFEERY